MNITMSVLYRQKKDMEQAIEERKYLPRHKDCESDRDGEGSLAMDSRRRLNAVSDEALENKYGQCRHHHYHHHPFRHRYCVLIGEKPFQLPLMLNFMKKF